MLIVVRMYHAGKYGMISNVSVIISIFLMLHADGAILTGLKKVFLGLRSDALRKGMQAAVCEIRDLPSRSVH